MSNNMYTDEERHIIIKYLIDNNITGNLQGNTLWKRIESKGLLNRTWQSMRSHFKHHIINTLYLYKIPEHQREMILHAFGRKARPNVSKSAKPGPPKKPIPFSSDSDSDTTMCAASQAKRPRRDSNASLDLLTCNANKDKGNVTANDNDINQAGPSTSAAKSHRDIRSYMASNAETGADKPVTSTPKDKHHKKRKKRSETVVIIDSDDDEPVKTAVMEQEEETENTVDNNEPFSLEEDTQLIMYFKTHQDYLADIRNDFVYVAFNYDTPSSLRTSTELRTRFVEHIMPKLHTYDCLTYEEMVTYYDRADIDVPVELEQIINKTVAEQKKNKHVAATKVTVDVSTQAERSSVDKMISTDVELDNILQEIVWENVEQLPTEDQPNPPDACPEADVVKKPIMIDASTQVSPARVGQTCTTRLVDASTQVEPPTREDKVCNTECQCKVDTATQTQQQKLLCNTDMGVQHVEFVTDNMLHIFLPEHDERKALQDLQNIHSNNPQKSTHMGRQRKCRVLNDKRYVDVAADASVRQLTIDKCETELLRLTAEAKRLEATLSKLRGYEARETHNKENQHAEHNNNLTITPDNCTIVSDKSSNTTIISCTAGSDSEIEVCKSDSGSQTANQPELNTSPADREHMDSSNATQDGDQEENSTVIEIQPDIEFTSWQMHRPIAVIETSEESDDTELPTDNSGCQIEPIEVKETSDESDGTELLTDNAGCQIAPLNLSTISHESEEHALSTNSDQFYSAVSQN